MCSARSDWQCVPRSSPAAGLHRPAFTLAWALRSGMEVMAHHASAACAQHVLPYTSQTQRSARRPPLSLCAPVCKGTACAFGRPPLPQVCAISQGLISHAGEQKRRQTLYERRAPALQAGNAAACPSSASLAYPRPVASKALESSASPHPPATPLLGTCVATRSFELAHRSCRLHFPACALTLPPFWFALRPAVPPIGSSRRAVCERKYPLRSLRMPSEPSAVPVHLGMAVLWRGMRMAENVGPRFVLAVSGRSRQCAHGSHQRRIPTKQQVQKTH
jgi:hypothetical protein